MSEEKPSNGGSSESDSVPTGDRRLVRLAPAWKPGQSGNPGGRPKTDKAVARRARELTMPLLESIAATAPQLVSICLKSDDEMAVIAAHRALTNTFEVVAARGLGRASPKPIDEKPEFDGDLDAQIGQVLDRLRARAAQVNVSQDPSAPAAPPPGEPSK